MFFVHYLGVGDADDMFNETILLCDLEDRHTVLPILLHPLGATIRPCSTGGTPPAVKKK